MSDHRFGNGPGPEDEWPAVVGFVCLAAFVLIIGILALAGAVR